MKVGMLDNFLTQGYVLTNDKDAFKFIDLNEIKWTDAGHVGLQVVIKDVLIKKQLQQNIVVLILLLLKQINEETIKKNQQNT